MGIFGHGRSLSVSKDLTNPSKQPSNHLPEKYQVDMRLAANPDQTRDGEVFP